MDESLILKTLDKIISGVPVKDEPVFNFWSDQFKGKYKTRFAASPEHAYIGARSMVSGMGINWATQYRKIKNRFGCCHLTTGASNDQKILVLHRDFIEKYLASINLFRISEESAETVLLYKKEFSDYVHDQTMTNGDLKKVDFYLDADKGIQRLVSDAFKLQNQGVIKHFIEIFSYLEKNPDILGLDHCGLHDRMIDIAEILSNNQNKLK